MSKLSESTPMEKQTASEISNVSINRQYLEPTGSTKIKEFLNITQNNGTTCPEIKYVGRSKLLSQVKSFLPELKASELSLNAKLEAGEDVNIENIQADAPHIEMNFQINETDNNALSTSESSDSDSNSSISTSKPNDVWTSDSDPDSPPSPAERDNSWTSDSDIDSSSSSSCRSSSSSRISNSPSTSHKHKNLKDKAAYPSLLANMDSSNGNTEITKLFDTDNENRRNEKLKRKKPLIEDITPSNSNISCESQLNTINVSVNKKFKYDDG